MARKPSERRNAEEMDMELNLTPMMNLISILIPVLLISTVFVEMAVINVSAPAIGSASDSQQQKKEDKPEKPPLNLTVTITDKGYTLAATGGVLGNEQKADEKGPTIPLIQSKVSCNEYLGTWPPPRSMNRTLPRCENEKDERTYWVYDTAALTQKLVDIKDAFPDERRIILAAEPDVEYETITHTMDASRDIKEEGGERRTLFDEVVLSPGLS